MWFLGMFFNCFAFLSSQTDVELVSSGTGTNEVEFACYPDEASRQTGLQLIAGNSSDVAVGTGWARSTLFANTCAVAQNLTGDLISTAFVARDLMQVVDALDEDGMLRFWVSDRTNQSQEILLIYSLGSFVWLVARGYGGCYVPR